MVVTYSRIPPADLWNVSVDGLAGGFGRALVLLNFPVALLAIALAALAADRLGTRRAYLVALLVVPLALVVVVPGTVEADDVDAKWVNVVPALGVALAVALTVAAVARRGVGQAPRRVPGDPVRIVLAALLLVAAIPWIGAELGFSVSLGGIFASDEIVPEPGHPNLIAVHFGHHHGTDGVLFSLAALALSRELSRIRAPRLRVALTAYLALMLVYGLANTIDDFWLEQVVKRDGSDFVFPGMLRPTFSPAWLGIMLAAGAVYALFVRSLPARTP